MKLKEIIEKSYKYDKFDLGLRYIGRPFSYLFVWLLYSLGITANQVSMFNLIFFIVPIILIACGFGISGTSILLFYLVLESIDGGIARLRNNRSLKGKYLGYLFHELGTPCLFFALGLYSYKYFNLPVMIVLGALTMFSIFTINISKLDKYRIIFEHSIKVHKIPLKHKHFITSQSSILFYLVYSFTSIGHLFMILFLMSVFGILHYAIILYFIFYFLMMIVKLCMEIKREIIV